MRDVNVHVCPPMCVYGNTSPKTSSSVMSSPPIIASADGRTVESAWRAPFGSAVVPDV
jgi:hypothetical protein